jgi:predicted nucleotidyltransferase
MRKISHRRALVLDSAQAIRLVAERLGPLGDRLVFLGGATVGLLVLDPGGAPPRTTKDVDVVVEVASRWEYQGELRNELLQRGFREDTDEGAPICRWVVDQTKVDIMPTKGEILGLDSRWFPAAFSQAVRYQFPGGPSIRLVSAPCFLATKLDAFHDRGGGDYRASADVEDIIAVVDGRATIEQEIQASSSDVRGYIADEITRLIAHESFLESLPGHLPGDSSSQERLPTLLARLRRIANIRG